MDLISIADNALNDVIEHLTDDRPDMCFPLCLDKLSREEVNALRDLYHRCFHFTSMLVEELEDME